MDALTTGIANLFFAPLGLHHFLTFSALLFGLGIAGALSRRNAIGILMALELMLNAVNVNLVAFWRYGAGKAPLEGQMFALFVITVAAAEAAVGLAIILAIFRIRRTVNADEVSLMKG
jgi:NADH-quinone oxidoreductase subunit K